MRATNWAGNVTFSAAELLLPDSVEALASIMAANDRVRALGTGHSFSPVADTSGVLVSLAQMPKTIDIDAAARTVRVGAGVRFGELAGALDAEGLALHNMGSLPHISVAGACATGTHGSGVGKGNLASAVVAFEMVTADGSLVRLSRGDDDFPGAVVALGALGIVTTLTLAVVPAFQMRQWVYDDLPLEVLISSFDEVMGSAYSVSAFLDWTSDRLTTVWRKMRDDEPGADSPDPRWMGARLADGPRHPIVGIDAQHCTEQGGVLGPWHARLPHFRMEFTPSNGDELQSEYLLDARLAGAALTAVNGVRAQIAPAVQCSEIRTIAADDLWMSASYEQDSVAFHFTWVPDLALVEPALQALESALEPFRARPHWGKVFRVEPSVVRSLVPRIGDFEALVDRYDPIGKFGNAFLDTYLTRG